MKERHVSLDLHFKGIFRHGEKVLTTERKAADDLPAAVGGRG